MQRFGGFFDAESCKESHLHDLTLSKIDCRQRIQGIVERNQFVTRLARDDECFVQRDYLGAATSFLKPTGPRSIHEDASHHSGRHREEMRTILPPYLIDFDQPQV